MASQATAPSLAAAESSTAPSAISVEGLSKSFVVPHERYTTVRERAVHPFSRPARASFSALEDVSFEVRAGEMLGIVGPNGSGKSTLMRCIAGIYRPDHGGVRVDGRLAPFIELGVGFNPELSARHNIVVNAVMLGLAPAEARSRIDDIVEFAGVEEFVDMKLKNFSTGMMVRLAFAVTVQVQADVLLFDEVLAVGDAQFRRRCYEHFDRLHEEGRTIVLVTHDMDEVRRRCDRALLLRGGRVVDIGPPEAIARNYEAGGGRAPLRTPRPRPRETEAPSRPSGPRMLDPDLGRLWAVTRVLAVAQFRLRYLDSGLSYLWALAGPLAYFGILWLVFTHVGNFDNGVSHYPLYLLTSFMLWTFFTTATAAAVSCLVQAGDVLRKVPVPHGAVPLSVVLMSLFEVSLNFIAVLILLAAGGVEARLSWLELPALILVVAAFAVGMSLIVSALYVRHRDIDQIWILGRQALFYGSPIFYVLAALPDGAERALAVNPLAAVFTQARHALIDPAAPSAASVLGGPAGLLLPAVVVGLVLALGVWVFARESPHAAENL